MNTKILVVGSQKGKTSRVPKIRLAGLWLNDIGFKPESFASVHYEHKSITIKLEGTGLDACKRLIRQARTTNSGLLHITRQYDNEKLIPNLEIRGLMLETLGFKIGSTIVIRFEYGSIIIKLLELDKLGL